jgi:hypothetical protein
MAKNNEYEHHEFVEQDEDLDLEQEFYILRTTVDALIELLIEKKILSESEFEKKYDELCEESGCSCDDEDCECDDECDCDDEDCDCDSVKKSK